MTGGFRSRSKSGDKPKPERDNRERREERRDRGQRRDDHRGSRNRDRGKGQGQQRRGTSREQAAKDFLRSARQVGVDAPRAVAFDTLLRVETDDAFANLVLPKALRKAKLEGRDAAFATELTYGTLRALGVLDAVIARCATRGLEAMACGSTRV